MRDFEYCRPQSLKEAVTVLAEKGKGAYPLAGGTDILIELKRRRLPASCLVDIKAIPELRGIEREGDALRIGALTTHSELLGSSLIQETVPVIAHAARQMAFPEIRNRGTIGGNICNAYPAADLVPPLIALGSSVLLAGASGQREVGVAEFVLGSRQIAILPGEVLVAVKVPVPVSNAACAYARASTRKTGGIAATSAAAYLSADGGVCRQARIVLGAIEAKPRFVAEAAGYLEGTSISEDVAKAAAKMSVSGLSPIVDPRLSVQYRSYMTELMVRQAVLEAWAEVNR